MSSAMLLLSAICWLAVASCGAAAATAGKAAGGGGRGGGSGGGAQKPCHFLSQCACRDTRAALVVSCRGAHIGARVPLSALKKSGLLGGGNGTSAKTLALRMVRGNLSSVQSAAFAGLPVSLVDVSYNQILQLDEDAFAGAAGAAQRLSVLKLNGNRLTEVPAGALRGLDGLSVLEVAHNKLTSLGFVCHRPLPRLRLLSARGNAIGRIESGCWRNFTSLAYVDLAGNALSALPADAFDSLTASLQVLDLSENSLAHLHPSTFARLRALLELRLSGNRLSSVAFLCRVELPSLSYAVLSRNRIAAIDEDCWSGGPPRLAQVAGGAPANGTSPSAAVGVATAEAAASWPRALPRLRDLMLSGNKLRNMTAICGGSLPSLGRLALDRNFIRQVPRGCFANKTALHSVTMSDNKLSKLDCCLGFESTAVRHVDVSHNVIRSVSDRFLAGAPQLTSLQLQDNYLSGLAFLCGSRSHGDGDGGAGPEGVGRRAAKLHVTVDNALRSNIGKECVAEQKRGRLTIATPDVLEPSAPGRTARPSASPS